MIIPTILIYYFSFKYITQKRHDLLLDFEEDLVRTEPEIGLDERIRSFATESVDEQENDEAKINSRFDLKTAKVVLKKIYWFSGNLMMVYFLEYVTFTGFADRANPKKESDESTEYFTQHVFFF